jgi:tetratricopeptide (TPR) repeat protein
MQHRRIGKMRTLLCSLPFAAVSMNLPAAGDIEDVERLQELLYGEALFYSHQQDYLAAISRLQLAESQGLLPPSSDPARLLLARMKLAYGMHLEAGFDLHALPGDTLSETARNRAWYELARAFSHKGYSQAAAEALTHIKGELPTDIVGDHQLLSATVLMSLNRNREAAQELTQWRGAPELAAYAYYNRGVALVRSGDYLEAVPILETAVESPARTEELLALRDKARLSLGYIFARAEDYQRAGMQLQAVRSEGPFSNRALLALGWIAYKQGNRKPALTSWMELRGRSPTDPAVLETLLIVPAVHRELNAMPSATRDYEAAVTAYTSELDQLQDARESVEKGRALSVLLHNDSGSGQDANNQARQGATRFFGPLLASRNFQETRQNHEELRSMLDMVDRGLQEIDSLATTTTTAEHEVPESQSALPGAPVAPEPVYSQGRQPATGKTGEQKWQREWLLREGEPVEHPAAKIPELPEIESPAERAVKSLPQRQPSSTPPASGYLWALPSLDTPGLPETGILWLPDSGEFFGRPESGEFFRRPGEEEEDDYAYPDLAPKNRTTPGERYAVQLNNMLANDEQERGFNPGAVPVGQALRELAAALVNTTHRVAELDESLDPNAGLQERVAALRARILKLRARIANALTLHQSYTRAMALDELDRRQHLLEDLLEQASLELAKTYDHSSDH